MTLSRKLLPLMAALLVLSGLLVAAPAAATPEANATVCLVADPAGFDDGSFNALALAGAEEAAKGLKVDLVTADPGTESGIAAEVDAWAAVGQCDLIIGVGFIAGGAMEPTVLSYPDQRFAVIDYIFQVPGDTASVVFRADQPSFLVGYVAAAASSTGIVGVYGGWPIPPVTDFMNGYVFGVEYFNAQTGGAVEVLGWDVASQMGLFTGDFGDPALGYSFAADLFDQGADTVFAVAGGTSYGSYDAAVDYKLAGDEVRVVLPDFDPFELLGKDKAKVLLTSALKNVDVATYSLIESVVEGTWTSGIVVEDLASGGVDIAPFHRTNNQVPGFVRPALRDIRAGILDGTIPTMP